MDPDKAFAVQISHEEGMVSGPMAYMQCALLYTSSQGERRIRYVSCSGPSNEAAACARAFMCVTV